ncbi:MAG: cysteine peptidase family C39 domain-containing protein, partial [bacterium]
MSLIDNKLKSFRVAGNIPQWLVWIIAVCLFGIVWTAVGMWARSTALRDLKLTPDRWDENGVLMQETNYTCVPVSIVMLLREYGVETNTYDVALVAGTDIFGTSGAGIIRAGRHFGFDVTDKKMTFMEFTENGESGIIQFRSNKIKHAAFIKPVSGSQMIEVKDPSQGLLFFDKDGAID